MNFFGHATVASWRSNRPGFVLGAMLPDFATMIFARPPRVTHDDLRKGVDFHHETDRVFHELSDFRELEGAARRELTAAGLRRGSALAVAHIGTEILLDAVLARDALARRAYAQALSRGSDDALGAHIEWSEDQAPRFHTLVRALEERGVASGPLDPGRTALRIERALSGRPKLSLDGTARARVARWLPLAGERVESRAQRIERALRDSLC